MEEAAGAIPAPDEDRVAVGGEGDRGRDGGEDRGAKSGGDKGGVDEDGSEMVAKLAESEGDDERQAREEQEARELKAQLHLHYTRMHWDQTSTFLIPWPRRLSKRPMPPSRRGGKCS